MKRNSMTDSEWTIWNFTGISDGPQLEILVSLYKEFYFVTKRILGFYLGSIRNIFPCPMDTTYK